jgi:hypothetical protein
MRIMAVDINLKKLEEFIKIQKERQKLTQELSEQTGIDMSFTDEEVVKFAQEEYLKHINANISRAVEEEIIKWTKSLYS